MFHEYHQLWLKTKKIYCFQRTRRWLRSQEHSPFMHKNVNANSILAWCLPPNNTRCGLGVPKHTWHQTAPHSRTMALNWVPWMSGHPCSRGHFCEMFFRFLSIRKEKRQCENTALRAIIITQERNVKEWVRKQKEGKKRTQVKDIRRKKK